MNPGSLLRTEAVPFDASAGAYFDLLVRRTDGPALCFLLVSREGRPVNKQVLNLVAEPVEIRAQAERQGELLVLRSDPETYRRVR